MRRALTMTAQWAKVFNLQDMRLGIRQCLPVGLSVGIYGSVLGMLAAQKGLTGKELLLMGATVFAGASQFVAIDMWNTPLPIVGIILATVIVNMRYLLICASLRSVFEKVGVSQRLLGIFPYHLR